MFSEKEKRSKFHAYGFVMELHFCQNYILRLVKERKIGTLWIWVYLGTTFVSILLCLMREKEIEIPCI